MLANCSLENVNESGIDKINGYIEDGKMEEDNMAPCSIMAQQLCKWVRGVMSA